MTAEIEHSPDIAAESGPKSAERRSARRVRVFGSLTRRIVVLNLAGLVVLLSGILYLNQFRAGLIDARIQSLTIQGEIMSNAR